MLSAATVLLVKVLQVALESLGVLQIDAFLWPPVREVQNNTCFDYIIVGGGTSGCVLANRLTEDPDINVLLIEAGGNPQIRDLVPALFFAQPNSNIDWAYTGSYDPYAASAQNNHTVLQAGKVLGGSSTMNHLINARGARHDFDVDWSEIIGDDNWNYESVLPYFIKSERLEAPEIKASEFRDYHGYDGLQGIGKEDSKLAYPYLESFNETGNDVVLDLNGNITIGYTQSMVYVTEGVRQSSAYAFLKPIRNRSNLYVMRYSRATKILFEDKRAVAVEVVRNNETYVYRACKEIIVSAGVYNSPQLLMLSGIGPKEHLEAFNIDVISDLPVGNNLQDQVTVSLVFKVTPSIAIPIIPPPTNVPFPILIGLAALDPKQSFADYQVFSLVYQHDLPFILLTCAIIFPYRYDICDSFNIQSVGRDSLYTLLTNTKPDSKGTVRLVSSNPFDKPNITLNYFRNQTDLDNMVKYVKDFIKVGNSSYFQNVGAELVYPDIEACKAFDRETDEDSFFACYVLNTAVSVYHTSSTCHMGTKGVVDSRLRVYNVTNLRVVDASSMPKLTSGSPNAVVVMMAEKAADMIKENAGNNSCSGTCVLH